ncbi:MAG: hypothetical protein R3B68_15375 [Phycisphaerales bacterium]
MLLRPGHRGGDRAPRRPRATWCTRTCAPSQRPRTFPRTPTPAFKEVLGKTLGVPLFQEQRMALAVKAAFTPGEPNAAG